MRSTEVIHNLGDTLNSPIESKYKLLKDVRKSKNFTVSSANVQSMNNKFQEIRDITHSVSPVSCAYRRHGGKIPLLITQSECITNHIYAPGQELGQI